MTLEEEVIDVIRKIQEEIDGLSHIEICRLWRFAPAGHRYFDENLPYFDILKKRLDKLGGFTQSISKEIGWEQQQS